MLKLMGAFVVGVGAGLAVSWSYILTLKARIRVCTSYIHDRIGKGMGTEYMDRTIPEELEAKGPEKLAHTPSAGATSSGPERARMAERPKLIVSTPRRGGQVVYVCSGCLRVFPLLDDPSPKKVMAELFRRFQEHREQEHPEASPARSRETLSPGGVGDEPQ
jgi:hypothetical protein